MWLCVSGNRATDGACCRVMPSFPTVAIHTLEFHTCTHRGSHMTPLSEHFSKIAPGIMAGIHQHWAKHVRLCVSLCVFAHVFLHVKTMLAFESWPENILPPELVSNTHIEVLLLPVWSCSICCAVYTFVCLSVRCDRSIGQKRSSSEIAAHSL